MPYTSGKKYGDIRIFFWAPHEHTRAGKEHLWKAYIFKCYHSWPTYEWPDARGYGTSQEEAESAAWVNFDAVLEEWLEDE